MAPTNQTDPDFSFRQAATPPPADPLGPLALLQGKWSGTGLNTIWRPHFPSSPQDRILELNLTQEQLEFSPIAGPIPNRGLLQDNIDMFGLTYMQQINDAVGGPNAGLHIEPGIWATVPATTAPAVPTTVVRLASVPHGTVVLLQGVASGAQGGPVIEDNNLIPFGVGAAPAANSDFDTATRSFPEMDLSKPTDFRISNPGITQDMVRNPNSVLRAGIAGQTVKHTSTLSVTTTDTPVPGGCTANTAFLQFGNANASVVSATFWVETLADPEGGADLLQLQYSQAVMLDFNGLRWPHLTVATLRKAS